MIYLGLLSCFLLRRLGVICLLLLTILNFVCDCMKTSSHFDMTILLRTFDLKILLLIGEKAVVPMNIQ